MYKIFEKYEYYVNETRFYIYIITFIIIQIFIVKRFFYGGASNPIHLNLSKWIAIIFFVIKIIYFLLSLGYIVLGIFSLVLIINYKDLQKENGEEDVGVPILLFILIIIHTVINLGTIIVMFKYSLGLSKKLCSLFISYKEELTELYEGKKGINNLEFIGYDAKFHTLSEIIIPGLPRYLFYALDGNDGHLENSIIIRFDNNNNNEVNVSNNSNRGLKNIVKNE